MNRFLLALVMTLVAAASLVTLLDYRQRSVAPPPLSEVQERLLRIETLLAERAAATTPGTTASADPDERPDPSVRPEPSLKDVIARLTEIEGMLWDSERAMRQDLKGIFDAFDRRLAELRQASTSTEPPTAASQAALIQKLEEMGIRLVPEEGQIELKGEMGRSDRALEFVAVAPGGRAHESLLVVDVIPSALKLAIEILGVPEAGDPDPESLRYPEGSGKLFVYVHWDKAKKPRRAEDMIQNSETKETLSRTHWMFTASYTYTDTRKWQRVFAGDLNRNLIAAVWSYAAECLLACPLEETLNENIWFPFEGTIPPPGTPVRVILRKEAHADWDAP